MNFTISCPNNSFLEDIRDDILYKINDRRKNRQKKKQRYQKRLSTSISDMKYLDRVVLVDGCTYRIEHLEKKEASVECVGRKIRYGQHLPERGASPS